MPTAANVDAFDGRATTREGAPKPPSASIERGSDRADALPSATGRPALAQQTDGTDELRCNTQTFQAGDSRPTTSSGRGTSAAVSSYADARV